ncbi:MAG: 2-keto-4-pentenoate hydratase/2-oxohepta-3-ene-1,7-dioic acid hydratase in catechol pathway [Planctomycetota bacterium]|jgi:2-keto-4-pentenoate hydratase/2-oxohepta-3-ene-1,7-dioic acid hydratase in catechol pathway
MTDQVRAYRRLEGDLIRSGRVVLQVGERFFDLTEKIFQSGEAALLSSLTARGFFAPEHFGDWLESANLKPVLPIQDDDELLAPFLPIEVGKIVALGKNFVEHAAEFKEEVPKEMMYFNKLAEGMCGHNQVVYPPLGYEDRFDHEVELAVYIGQLTQAVSPDDALQSVSGFSVANDLTLRTLQGEDRKERYPWFRSKNFDRACPIGPCFVPASSLDVSSLRITAHVNGELRQSATTADFVVSIAQAISTLSHHMTLYSGDILLMGTPSGVGPLKEGDQVVCEIEGIGVLANTFKRPEN